MDIEVTVDRRSSTNGFADTYLSLSGNHTSVAKARLDVEYSPIWSLCGSVPDLASDLLLFGATVYATDKLVKRETAEDAWTRTLNISIPVADRSSWESASPSLESCVSFLTGDEWSFEFAERKTSLILPSTRGAKTRGSISDVTAVSLFSGGLDSMIGVIDWLEESEGKLLVVGHHDGDVAGPLADQRKLLGPISTAYPGRVKSLLVRGGVKPSGSEISFRSRSLLFLAIALHVASASRSDIPVLIPENGNIALNVPLTPSRQGSCSTRTAHPHYLHRLLDALVALGVPNRIENPLREKTKGECVTQCKNQKLLRALYVQSVSCAKRGHTSSWVRRRAGQCGRCTPCVYRRAALHAAGLDDEIYGSDFCRGEVAVVRSDGSGAAADGAADVRAILAFLRARPSEREISRRLASNGRITFDKSPAASALVQRAMREVAQLVADKGTKAVRKAAGV